MHEKLSKFFRYILCYKNVEINMIAMTLKFTQEKDQF